MEPCDTGRLGTCGMEYCSVCCLSLSWFIIHIRYFSVKHGLCLSFAGVDGCLVCIQFLPPAVPFTGKMVSGKKLMYGRPSIQSLFPPYWHLGNFSLLRTTC